jgi:hypothetical protein
MQAEFHWSGFYKTPRRDPDASEIEESPSNYQATVNFNNEGESAVGQMMIVL